MEETTEKPAAEDRPKRGRPPGSPSKGGTGRRLSIALDASGRPDLDRMRDDTKDEIRAALPQLRRAFGSTEETKAIPVPPWIAASLTAALSQLSVLLVARMSGAPHELVLKHAPLTEEESRQVAPALDAVLAKHGGGWLSKYGDELALGVLLLAIGQKKITDVGRAWETEQSTLRTAVNQPAPVDVDWTAKGTADPGGRS